MRYFSSICAGLLVLMLIMQLRVLRRLDDIAGRSTRPGVSAGTAVSVSPTASAIASEIRRQMAKDQPPAFTFQHRTSAAANGQLTQAVFWMIRKAGPASDLSVKTESGIIAQLGKVRSADYLNDSDCYEVSFKPKSGALPASWTFSVSYIDHDEKTQERVFVVVYHPDKTPPAHLQVTERHE